MNRPTPDFPDNLVRAFAQLRSRLDSIFIRIVDLELEEALACIDTLPVRYLAKAERNFWQLAGLSEGYPDRPNSRHLRLLDKYPDLAPIFLRHTNGFVREAALRKIGRKPSSAFVFASVIYRLNDWVPQVRLAAAATAKSNHR